MIAAAGDVNKRQTASGGVDAWMSGKAAEQRTNGVARRGAGGTDQCVARFFPLRAGERTAGLEKQETRQ
jgi:hypothetical protein